MLGRSASVRSGGVEYQGVAVPRPGDGNPGGHGGQSGRPPDEAECPTRSREEREGLDVGQGLLPATANEGVDAASLHDPGDNHEPPLP